MPDEFRETPIFGNPGAMTAIINRLELCLVFRGMLLLFIYRYNKLGLGGKAVEAVELCGVGF